MATVATDFGVVVFVVWVLMFSRMKSGVKTACLRDSDQGRDLGKRSGIIAVPESDPNRTIAKREDAERRKRRCEGTMTEIETPPRS